MTYRPHQIEASNRIAAMLRDRHHCLCAGEPRVGKCRTALRTIELLGFDPADVLILCPKGAIPGWESEQEAVGIKPTVTNYEQVHKLPSHDWKLVILDESHRIGTPGKASKRFKAIRQVAWNSWLLCLSGTPTTEGLTSIYYQMAISQYGPFKSKTFYDWFRSYGVPSPIWIGGRSVESYKKAKPELSGVIAAFTVTVSQEDAGIDNPVTDKIHRVTSSLDTEQMIQQVITSQMFDGSLVESDMAERNLIYQIPYGAALVDGEIREYKNHEVLEYCLDTFGPGAAYMCHYRSTAQLFGRYCPNIFSSTKHKEGVDLSDYELVVLNHCYSGSGHLQRRQRIANMNVKGERIVHFVQPTAGIAADVYDAVSAKRDFQLSAFREWRSQRQRLI